MTLAGCRRYMAKVPQDGDGCIALPEFLQIIAMQEVVKGGVGNLIAEQTQALSGAFGPLRRRKARAKNEFEHPQGVWVRGRERRESGWMRGQRALACQRMCMRGYGGCTFSFPIDFRYMSVKVTVKVAAG